MKPRAVKKPTRKTELSSEEKDILQRNYLKLWLMERVNFPFIVRLAAIQRPVGLPLKGGSEKFETNLRNFSKRIKEDEQKFLESKEFLSLAPLINKISELGLPQERAKQGLNALIGDKFPWVKFQNEIKKLAEDFGFNERWIPHLTVYVITGLITAPHDCLDKDAPPEHITDDWKIFLLVSKMRAQHGFLKNRDYKSAPRSRGTRDKSQNKYISDLQDTAGEIFPDALIHDYLEIGLLVWGNNENDGMDELGKLDKRKINLVKKHLARFIKRYCVPATDDDLALLRSLPKTT